MTRAIMLDDEISEAISEVSATSGELPLEVTHEDYLRNSQRRARFNPTTPPGSNASAGAGGGSRSGGVRRFTSLLGGRQGGGGKKSSLPPLSGDHGSVGSETKSLYSSANKTIGSMETIKVSNKAEKPASPDSSSSPSKKEKKRWNKLKRMIGVKSSPEATRHDTVSSVDGVASATGNRQRSLTEESTSNEFKPRRRVRSSPDRKTIATSEHLQRHQQEMDDDSIRGRFDGVDILYLGGVHLTVASAAAGVSVEKLPPWDQPVVCTFTGQPTRWSPAEVVSNAVWASSGRDPPEIILDGFCPGPDGRWSVRIMSRRDESAATKDKPQAPQKPNWFSFDSTPPPLQMTRSHDDSTSDDGGSPVVSLRRLLWGSDPTPSDVAAIEAARTTSSFRSENSDPMLDLGARCSIPIDIDDDTFIISTREHIHSLHDVASVSLAKGDLQDALRIFEALLKGLDSLTDDDLRFMKGSVIHNMGVLQLWMGQPADAVATFSKALEERMKQLPSRHPDIAVTLARKAAACFGLGRHGEAIAGLNEALAITPEDHLIRAKLLNNLGVIHYFQNDAGGALREFTKGIEIQRNWLENPVRRVPTVYEAAVTLSNMGKVYLETSEDELALYLYEEALLLETTVLRKDHDFVLMTLTSLAVAKAQNGQFSKALQILQGCLRSRNTRFGVLSAESMETVGLNSYVYARKGDLENALKCLLTVRKWQKANLAENHTALLKSRQCQKAIEAKLGENEASSVSNVWI